LDCAVEDNGISDFRQCGCQLDDLPSAAADVGGDRIFELWLIRGRDRFAQAAVLCVAAAVVNVVAGVDRKGRQDSASFKRFKDQSMT
jgi:hypothetical protein